jgi:hypothetical protein
VKAAADADSDKTAKSGCGTDVIASILQDPGIASLTNQTRYAARKPAVPQASSPPAMTQTAGKKPDTTPVVQ